MGATATILAPSATNLAVQFELRFLGRGTKLKSGDGYAAHLEESLANKTSEVKSYLFPPLYLSFHRYVYQIPVRSTFTIVGSSN